MFTLSARQFLVFFVLWSSFVLAAKTRAAPLTTETILRQMFLAEREVAFSGTQTTVVYSRAGLRKTRQVVMYKPPNLFRIEYESPAEMKGQFIVMDGTFRWRYLPHTNTVFKTAQPSWTWERGRHHQRRGWGKKNFDVRYLGEDSVCGRAVHVIEIHPQAPGPPMRRLWIDQEAFVRLKTQRLDATGKVIETTEFEKIDLSPKFGTNVFRFTPPTGAQVVETSSNTDRETIKSLSEMKQKAPFPVRTPSFLPKGFAWESGSLQTRGRFGTVVWMRYTDGINTLSLFQRRSNHPLPESAPRLTTRGAVIWSKDDSHFILVGNLPEDTMLQIARSVE